MKVYIPSCLGDVSLEREGNCTKLVFKALTPLEEKAVAKFLKAYELELVVLKPVGLAVIPDSLDNAHKKFVKAFKSGKPVINAIKLTDGKMEIVSDFTEKEGKGVTTEKPTRGCPAPVYEKEIRGTAVLHEFLTPQQWVDFEKHKAFVSRGNNTGAPYLLTSRWNPDCERWGVLYSLATRRSICASLNHIPPSEELLAMKICVECDERRFVGLA